MFCKALNTLVNEKFQIYKSILWFKTPAYLINQKCVKMARPLHPARCWDWHRYIKRNLYKMQTRGRNYLQLLQATEVWRHNGHAFWLERSTLDRVVQVQALAGVIVLHSWARCFKSLSQYMYFSPPICRDGYWQIQCWG